MILVSSAWTLAFLSVLIGPLGPHIDGPTLIPIGLTISGLGAAFILGSSSRGRSVALLSVLGIMLYESMQPVTVWLHTELPQLPIFGGVGVEGHLLFPLLFSFNVDLGVVGAAAAAIVALWLSIRKACLPLTKQFPEMSFVTAPAELVRTVSRLSRRAGILTPRVSLIDSGKPAAFITWSGRQCILLVSVGLLESLTHDELDACIAHEISHLKNNDLAVRSFATSIRVALFAHPLSHLIEPALYRAREFLADKTAVQLIGGRDSLIAALTKIRESQDYITSEPGSVATACLFDPTSRNRFVKLFEKHPSLDARVKALRELNLDG